MSLRLSSQRKNLSQCGSRPVLFQLMNLQTSYQKHCPKLLLSSLDSHNIIYIFKFSAVYPQCLIKRNGSNGLNQRIFSTHFLTRFFFRLRSFRSLRQWKMLPICIFERGPIFGRKIINVSWSEWHSILAFFRFQTVIAGSMTDELRDAFILIFSQRPKRRRRPKRKNQKTNSKADISFLK